MYCAPPLAADPDNFINAAEAGGEDSAICDQSSAIQSCLTNNTILQVTWNSKTTIINLIVKSSNKWASGSTRCSCTGRAAKRITENWS